MAELIAIGYPNETTADVAARDAQRLASVLRLEADAIATVVRDREGNYHVSTTHRPAVGTGATWGMFWGLLFGLLFFVPVFGMAVGAGLGALLGKLKRAGIDEEFQRRVRDMVQPGTSAMFLVSETLAPVRVADALREHGGTVLKTSLSKEGEAVIQRELHGVPVAS